MKTKKNEIKSFETTNAVATTLSVQAAPLLARQEMVNIDEIITDPNQPRKYFDPIAQAELVESVRLHDLIQPIMVRPNPKENGYMLVIGERRFRAKKEVFISNPSRNTISCTIRELTNEQALELQVIENLQRKDVHPMEEASTFLFMLKIQNFSVAEIAARIGKQEYFVKQRLKLNDLTEGWQWLFFNGKINMSIALQISQMSTEIQTEFYESKTKDEDITSPDFTVTFNNWEFNSRKGKLSEAAFSLEDSTLIIEMGACTNCNFNTAAALLFPEDITYARCMNVTCFKKKNDIYFERAIEVAKTEEDIVFIKFDYGDTSGVSQKVGEKVLNKNDFYQITRPELPEEEEFSNTWIDDNSLTPETPTDEEIFECKTAYQNRFLSVQEEQKGYDEAVVKNEFKKAFVVDGSGMGKYMTIELTNSAKKKLKLDEMVANGGEPDAAAEIMRLETKEIRAKELDGEKVWLKINSLASGLKEAVHGEDFSKIDMAGVIIAMWNNIGYSSVQMLKDAVTGFSIKELSDNPSLITSEMFNAACRAFMMGVLPIGYGSHINGGQQKALYGVIQQYMPEEINVIEEEQKIIAEKRIQRVNERIEENKAKLEPEKKIKPKSKEKAVA